MELNGAVDRFLKRRNLSGLSPETVAKDRKCLKKFFDYLMETGVAQVEGLNSEVIADFHDYLALKTTASAGGRISPSAERGRFLAPEYRNQILVSTLLFLRWLYREDLLASDLSLAIRYAKRSQRLPKNILTVDEALRLLQAPDLSTLRGFRDRVILELLYGTGIRSKELRGVKVSDLDTSGGSLTIRRGKGGRGRVLPLGQGLCQLLEEYLAMVSPPLHGNKRGPAGRLAESEALFPGGAQGGEMSGTQLTETVRFYARKAALEKRVTPHALRHACATHMLQNGAPIRHVQELLGHVQLNTTMVYTHLTITDLKKAHMRYHPREKMKKGR